MVSRADQCRRGPPGAIDGAWGQLYHPPPMGQRAAPQPLVNHFRPARSGTLRAGKADLLERCLAGRCLAGLLAALIVAPNLACDQRGTSTTRPEPATTRESGG